MFAKCCHRRAQKKKRGISAACQCTTSAVCILVCNCCQLETWDVSLFDEFPVQPFKRRSFDVAITPPQSVTSRNKSCRRSGRASGCSKREELELFHNTPQSSISLYQCIVTMIKHAEQRFAHLANIWTLISLDCDRTSPIFWPEKFIQV